jgi:hypothetical protein
MSGNNMGVASGHDDRGNIPRNIPLPPPQKNNLFAGKNPWNS